MKKPLVVAQQLGPNASDDAVPLDGPSGRKLGVVLALGAIARHTLGVSFLAGCRTRTHSWT